MISLYAARERRKKIHRDTASSRTKENKQKVLSFAALLECLHVDVERNGDFFSDVNFLSCNIFFFFFCVAEFKVYELFHLRTDKKKYSERISPNTQKKENHESMDNPIFTLLHDVF